VYLAIFAAIAFGQVASPVILPKAAPAAQTVRTWEKVIVPGTTYRAIMDPKGPLQIHALRVHPGGGIRPEVALPGKTVFDDTMTGGRGSTTKIALDNGAFAAINGDFFPINSGRSSGDPLGCMIHNGELVSTPTKSRAAMGWGNGNSAIGYLNFSASFRPFGGTALVVNGVNEPIGKNETALFTPTAGYAMGADPVAMAVLIPDRMKLTAEGSMEVTIERVLPDANRFPIPPDRYVIAGQGADAALIQALKPGTRATLEWKTTGFDWKTIDNVIGGGPTLVKAGAANVTSTAEGFGPEFADKRHPRTAVGRTAAGDLWFVVVDGRSDLSVGVTLPELAKIMLDLRCVEAINLDGGGSSALSLFGRAVNIPSDGKERLVANGVAFIGNIPSRPIPGARIQLLREGDVVRAEVWDKGNQPITDVPILWTAEGGAIDQNGTFAKAPDRGTVWATLNGVTLTRAWTMPPTSSVRPAARTTGQAPPPNLRPSIRPASLRKRSGSPLQTERPRSPSYQSPPSARTARPLRETQPGTSARPIRDPSLEKRSPRPGVRTPRKPKRSPYRPSQSPPSRPGTR